MPQKKITGLPPAAAATGDQLLEAVNDPLGTPVSQKLAILQIVNFIATSALTKTIPVGPAFGYTFNATRRCVVEVYYTLIGGAGQGAISVSRTGLADTVIANNLAGSISSMTPFTLSPGDILVVNDGSGTGGLATLDRIVILSL